MTDPTKQAATAKTTREAIKEAVNVMAAATAWNWSDRTLEEVASDKFVSEPRPSELRLHAHAEAKAALALRALLDAPTGSVERLCEAAEEMVRAEEQYCIGTETTLEGAVLVHAGNAKRVYQSAIALRSALAALRASPESVGGAGVSEADDRVSRATYERARDEYTKASEALRKEREAHLCTKREASDNAVAVRSVRAERDALKDERDAVKRERKEMDGALEALTTEQDALKADLAAAQEFARVAEASWLGAEAELKRRDAEFREEWAKRQALEKDLAAARGEVERLRTEIAGDSHTCANGTVRPYPSVVCSLCVSRGITPPPATEAPISERAGAVLVSTVRIYLGDGGVWRIEDAGPLKCEPAWGIDDASICVRLPGRVAAAAERAAKGGAWS